MDPATMLQEWLDLRDSPVIDALLTRLIIEINRSRQQGRLSEEVITRRIKRENLQFVIDDKNQDHKEKCIICLEDYEDGDEIAKLDLCVHKFHFQCIKQWLMERNVCPICRETALNVSNAETEAVVEDNNEDVNA